MPEDDVDTRVVDYLASSRSLSGESDVLDIAPGMTYAQAYDAQFAAKLRQAPDVGPIIGYQASLTSAWAKNFGPPDFPKPYFGTLPLRTWRSAEAPFRGSSEGRSIECEVGMRMGSCLAGPNLTADDARRAVAGVHAAMEVVPPHKLAGRSGQHLIAVHNFGSSVVFGERAATPDGGLKSQPVELFCDGRLVERAVAGDSGGDPFAVLAAMANLLAAHGRRLEPGMIVMTGSATPPHRLPAGVRTVEARFGGGLGSATVTFEG